MKQDDNDIMHRLFANMTDEPLPSDFNKNVMVRIRHEAQLCERRNKRVELFGYISGAIAMIVVCIMILYYMGISFEFSEINWSPWTFSKPDFSNLKIDFSIFTTQSFKSSVYIGTLGLFLIVIDSFIRRHIEKTRHK